MNLTWQLAVCVRLVANAVGTYWGRKMAERNTLAYSLVILYLTASIFSTTVAVVVGQFDLSATTVVIFCIGICNGAAMYFLLMANSKSTSQNGFFTAFDDIAAMILMAIFVPVAVAKINWISVIGILLCIGAAFALAYNNYRKKRTKDTGAIPMVFYLYATLYTILWALAIFTLGFFALKDIGVWRFAAGWYCGSALTALVILAIDLMGGLPHPKEPKHASKGTIVLEGIGLGFSTALALVCQYAAFTVLSLVILQPLFLVSDVLVAIVIGVAFFGEGKKLDWRDTFWILIGIAGFFLVFLLPT